MAGYDNTNPFDDPDVKDAGHVDIDISDDYNQNGDSGYGTPVAPAATASSGSGPPAVPPAFNPDLTREALQERDDDLTRREREYEQRYGEFKQAQSNLGMNVKLPNWPCQCYAVTYHNIKGEIPQVHQGVMRKLYLLFLWSAVAFFWNGVAMLIAAAVIDNISFVAFLVSCLYFGLGIIASWKGWYRSAYSASINGSSRKWLYSFFLLIVHIAFTILMTVGPPNIGAAGLIIMFDAISENGGVTICLAVGAILWGLASLGGIVLLRRTYKHYRAEGGKSAQAAGQEIVQAEVRKQARKEAERQVREAKDGF